MIYSLVNLNEQRITPAERFGTTASTTQGSSQQESFPAKAPPARPAPHHGVPAWLSPAHPQGDGLSRAARAQARAVPSLAIHNHGQLIFTARPRGLVTFQPSDCFEGVWHNSGERCGVSGGSQPMRAPPSGELLPPWGLQHGVAGFPASALPELRVLLLHAPHGCSRDQHGDIWLPCLGSLWSISRVVDACVALP